MFNRDGVILFEARTLERVLENKHLIFPYKETKCAVFVHRESGITAYPPRGEIKTAAILFP